jgi:hypothetical protein
MEHNFPLNRTFNISGRYFLDIWLNNPKKYEVRAGNSRMVLETNEYDLLKIVHPFTGIWYFVKRGKACIHNTLEFALRCPKHMVVLPGTLELADQIKIYEGFGVTSDVTAKFGVYAIRLVPCSGLYFPKKYHWLFWASIVACIVLFYYKIN